ncbi:TetR/AcrR family transcriptional regulator [Streptomyces sp. bgisy100]|uniref:TetR/AcrR family transcriptional regulator n=1 Tax=Streptomyces sp. bgisy100 TaxID=3413783 RepID=UPI003D74960B
MIRMISARTAVSPSGAPVPRLGLRERKKIRTRQAIRRAAYRLFQEQGYDATPVERIAEAAEVSPSTVFRYFPTKEDIVLTDEYDPLLEGALRARPEDEPPLDSVRHVVVETLRRLLADGREELALRAGLVFRVPALRARMWERQADTARLLCRVLAERTGRPADDLDLRVFTAAVLGALHETLLHWAEGGLDGDVEDVMDHTMTTLTHGFAL